jgi:hypothetical protein
MPDSHNSSSTPVCKRVPKASIQELEMRELQQSESTRTAAGVRTFVSWLV